MCNRILKFILLTILISSVLFASVNSEIVGKVIDYETKLPLVGVNVFIPKLETGAATNIEGEYRIINIIPGTYTIQYSIIGYEKITKTSVRISPGKTKTINIEMKISSVELENVVVSAGYFNSAEAKPLSSISFSSDEVRRAPGSGGDISRILFSLPSVAKVNDQSNALIVRGGSPLENGFFVDNIEIPNINHYPTPGSSGGPIGIINVDLIEDVNFSSGGFSPSLGNRLSSFMEIKLRDGNKNHFSTKLNLSLQGLNGVAEGPIGASGSYIVAINKSYLDLVFKAIDESNVIPEYGDMQTKLSFDLSNNDKISIIDVLAIDYINHKYKNSYDNGNETYGPVKFIVNTAGINWRHLWNKNGYSNFSVSHRYSKNDFAFNETVSKNILLSDKSDAHLFSVRNVNHINISKNNKLEFGGEFKLSKNNFDQEFGAYHNEFGQKVNGFLIKKSKDFIYASGFANYTLKIGNALDLNFGSRLDYFDYTEDVVISPRFSFINKFSSKSSVQGSVGIYYQNLPEVVLLQSELFKNIKTPKAVHYVIGFSHLLSENTKLTIEAYDKQYSNLTIDASRPDVLLADETVNNGIFKSYANLNDLGKASAKGIELTIQKKLAVDFYGLISASYSKSTYKNADGKEFNRTFDNKFNFTIEGGYKPNDRWEYSLRWIYAGGRPFTPFDIARSTNLGKGVLDQSKLNSERFDDYHSLNIRINRRFMFNKSAITVYLSIWNAYGRENIASYYWNQVENKKDISYQWKMLPILGVEWEI